MQSNAATASAAVADLMEGSNDRMERNRCTRQSMYGDVCEEAHTADHRMKGWRVSENDWTRDSAQGQRQSQRQSQRKSQGERETGKKKGEER